MPNKSRFGPDPAHYRIGRKAAAADLHLIDGAFAAHMRERGYAARRPPEETDQRYPS